jgi:quinol monooxygenase YgiN
MALLTNLAFFQAKKTKSDALGEALRALVAPSRSDPGCVTYDLHRSIKDRNVWLVYENWHSSADLDAHMQSPHLQNFLRTAPELIEGEIDLQQFFMISAPLQQKVKQNRSER